jgi:hypothetical protein
MRREIVSWMTTKIDGGSISLLSSLQQSIAAVEVVIEEAG